MTLSDIDRPLNKRGKRDAPEMGRRLANQGIKPDMIVSSPARRARKTASQFAKALGFDKKKVTIHEGIYGATTDELLKIIQGFDATAAQVAMVGHNPETTVLANVLGDLDIDNVPTCGVVAFDFATDSWQEVERGTAALVFFDYPRNGGIKRSA
jgi:phosphohistidine phosphatase